jgi:hypothetical protein
LTDPNNAAGIPLEDLEQQDRPEGPPPPGRVKLPPTNPPEIYTVTTLGMREETRGQLARALLLILAFTIAGLFMLRGFGVTTEGFVDAILPSVIALVGTALGFYFGTEAAHPPGGLPTGGGSGP